MPRVLESGMAVGTAFVQYGDPTFKLCAMSPEGAEWRCLGTLGVAATLSGMRGTKRLRRSSTALCQSSCSGVDMALDSK